MAVYKSNLPVRLRSASVQDSQCCPAVLALEFRHSALRAPLAFMRVRCCSHACAWKKAVNSLQITA